MKTLRSIFTLFVCSTISSVCNAQEWIYSGTNIINNNPGGGVRVRQDATNAASIPAHGNWAFFSWGSSSHTSGTASKVWGAYLLSLNHSTGVLTESIGAKVTAGNESSGTGTVTNAYGLHARVQAGSGIVNTGYGVYIENTAATTDYGLYQAGSDDTNYFAGNVGIGTASPGSFKLAVEGKIGAREIIVTTTSPWPDYVFKSDYKLPSLQEVQRYIKANNHLPGIPSEDEIKSGGHKLGEMDVLLLKKVEELTLYILEQEARIKTLEAKIKELTED